MYLSLPEVRFRGLSMCKLNTECQTSASSAIELVRGRPDNFLLWERAIYNSFHLSDNNPAVLLRLVLKITAYLLNNDFVWKNSTLWAAACHRYKHLKTRGCNKKQVCSHTVVCWFGFFFYSGYDYHGIHLVWKRTVPSILIGELKLGQVMPLLSA